VKSGTSSFSSNLFQSNNGGYILYTSTAGITPVTLGAGTYYLELYNAVASSGVSVFWDENNGPSTAYENDTTGPIGSETFAIYGTSAATPEPGTMIMFGTGVLGLLGAARRRFSR
jgi:hypothetical protein